MKEEIQVNLSEDEAVVLFEFLSRFSNEEILEIADQSEHEFYGIFCAIWRKF